ncbi:MAG: DNA recombination protein RmuC [Elusimicrobiaceae bacterium]|nr:DNA recombination protein RmuC [Elusimicrobiaceae bacterium]MBP5617483.1 DNA recombination protein RmuC [Elusimicrobiaceae bacterium]
MQLLLAFLAGAAVVGLWAFWKINQLKLENVRLQERKNALDQTQTNQEKLFNTLQKQAQDSFKQLAAESLKAQKEELVTKNKDLFTPIKETMDRFTTEMGHLRTEAAQRHGSLQTALDQTKALNEKLSKEANDLTTALKNPKTQGTWGEIILEDVLTSMGLREGVEFEKQVSFKTDQGDRQQPDFIVHLPQQRDLIIDSKMSLNSYTKWANETNETEKRKLLKEHTRAVEEHIKELAAKDYPKLLKNEKLDFTLMFIPIEYAYFAALQENPSLNDLARQHHIYIVTASNLLTVLQIAENLWRVEHSTKTMNQIFKTAQDMHERVARFLERMQDLDAKIAGVQKAYANAAKSLTGPQSIVTSAKQLEQMRIKSARKLPELFEEPVAQLSADKDA